MFSQFYTMFQLSDYKKGLSIQEIFKSTKKIHFIAADQRMFGIAGFATMILQRLKIIVALWFQQRRKSTSTMIPNITPD